MRCAAHTIDGCGVMKASVIPMRCDAFHPSYGCKACLYDVVHSGGVTSTTAEFVTMRAFLFMTTCARVAHSVIHASFCFVMMC